MPAVSVPETPDATHPASSRAGIESNSAELEFRAIRAHVLERLLRVIQLSAGAGSVLFLPLFVKHHRLNELFSALALIGLLAAIERVRLNYAAKATLLLACLGLLTTLLIFEEGLGSGPIVLGFSLPFLAVLFLDLRAAFLAFAWSLITIASFGVLNDMGWYVVAENPSIRRIPTLLWPYMALAQVFSGGPIVYVAHLLVRRLQESLSVSQTALNELERAQTTLAAGERLKTLGLIAGGIAHDLNNTLTVIYGEVELAKGMPEDSRESVLEATRAAGHLARQMLLSAGQSLSQPRPVELQRSLRPALKALKRTLPESVQLVVQWGSEELVVFADPVLLQQALFNLVLNSRDAMPTGGTLEISASLEHAAGIPWAVVRVRDTGNGMDAATLRRSTEPFFTTKAPGHGTGLGLSNVRSTVESYGGSLHVESTPGVGTLVELRLPVSTQGVTNVELSLSTVEAEGRRVLLVEDNLRVRAICFEVLGNAGFEVEEAACIAAATHVAAAPNAFHAVVTDLVLPDGSGLAFARSLRQRHPAIGVLIMSGYSPSEADRAALRDHEFLLLPKPFTSRQLLAALASALQKAPS